MRCVNSPLGWYTDRVLFHSPLIRVPYPNWQQFLLITGTIYIMMDATASESPQKDNAANNNNKSKNKTVTRHTNHRVHEEITLLKRDVPELVSRNFEIIDKVGEGTYSRVFRARISKHNKDFALKRILSSNSPERIQREMECLKKLNGAENIAKLLMCVRHKDTVVLVLDYFEHQQFKDYYDKLQFDEIRSYVKGLLQALAHVHSLGIVHRDVKPSNFLYNRQKKKYLLVDFGLAQTYDGKYICDPKDCKFDHLKSKTQYSKKAKRRRLTNTLSQTAEDRNDVRASDVAARAGTRGFRAPEILLRCKKQSSALDIWSMGVILLSILSRRFPFFRSDDDGDALAELSHLFGLEKMKNLAYSLGKELLWGTGSQKGIKLDLSDMEVGLAEDVKSARGFCDAMRGHSDDLIADCAYDFLVHALHLEPWNRLTAEEGLKHNFLSV